MKPFYYSIPVLLLFLLSACTKQLTQKPPSNIVVNTFYTNATDFSQAVNGVYNGLSEYPDQALWMGELRSDNVTATSDGNRDWQGINDFSPNLTTTAFIVGAWDNNFNNIYTANTVLEALDTKGQNIGNDSLRTRFKAECRFLRAFYYFTLLRFYGKLPIIDKVYTPAQVQSIGRSPVTDVYNFIIGDLKFAADSLPGSYPSTETGRATKWAAKGLLGLVYLTRSGPTYNIEGPGLNSNEYDKALAQFNDIIANGGFKFITNYPSIFSYTNENNSEVLFDVQFMTTTNGADYPSQLTIGAYWTGLGLSGYDNGYGTSYTTVTKNLIQSYRTSANNGLLTDIRDTFSIKHAFPTNASKPTSLDTTRPFLKKYIDVSRRGTKRSDWPINFIVMRYTDVLMMKAECILHGAAGSQADVNSIVAQVRARAGVPALTTDVTLPALMEERRREFLGEGIRWNDLVREGMAVDVMNAWRVSDSISSVKPIIANYMIYPVPQAELLVRQGVYTQNPGYN